MAIVFAGGTVANRGNLPDVALVIRNQDAAQAGWRDFRAGLTAQEQGLFRLSPLGDGRGELALAAAGGGPPGPPPHQHVRRLIEAVQNAQKTIHVMPKPVFQQLEPNLQWIRAVVTRDNPNNFSFAITINGYGNFPAEWLGLEVAGRTHRARRAAPQDACVYAT